jgi:hypothetical protein
MKLHTIIIIISLNILFFLSTLNKAYSDECEAQSKKQIDKYIETCQDSNNNIQEIGFAPHQEKRKPKPGGYAYERIEESYPDKTFPIGDKNYQNKIWFYTNIKKDKNFGIPKYIWHLIISPAPKIQQKDDAEGFFVNIGSESGNLDKLGLLEEKEEEYLARSLVEGSNPVIYTNNELDRYQARPLNRIWEKLVKNQNFLLVKCERMREGNITDYDYTFYLHKIDEEPNNINLNFGYRIPSMKTITSAGEVYGLILNEDGLCLGYKKITAK